jgi:hypothetical protein
MDVDKYNIAYLEIELECKPIFVFVNHKTAVLCWAKIKEQLKEDFEIITFDSHGDFHGGGINGENLLKSDLFFGSKYLTHLQHFSQCKEFINWNLLDDTQNSRFIKQEQKFLFFNNDNFIDVAFMKNIVNNVYWYYLNLHGNCGSGKCEDINDKDHFFIKHTIRSFKQPSKPFILDIDLDFFVKSPGFNSSLVSINTMKKYLKLQKSLFSNELCRGLSIALEPGCCGGEDNCLKILNKLFQEFSLDLLLESKELIKRAK